MYTLTQFVCILLAVISMGQSIQKEASKFDRVLYGVYSIIFVFLIVLIEGVFKC